MSYTTFNLQGGGIYKFTVSAGASDGSETFRFIGGSTHPFGIITGADSAIGGDLDVGLDQTSELRCTGDVIAFAASDINLKTDITKIANPIAKIKQLSGNTFTWKPEAGAKKAGNHDVGVIAQEVYNVLPTITRTVNDVMSVRYEKLIPLLIECIKDQQTQIEKLNCKIEEKLCQCQDPENPKV